MRFAGIPDERGKRRPWTEITSFGTSANGQRAVIIIGRGVVCSRGVNGRSGHGIHDHTIAVKTVATRLATGGAGGRASSIGRPRTASNTDANSRSDIESVCASGKQRQLTRSRRARASALRRSRKIFWDGRAFGLVATSFSPCGAASTGCAAWCASMSAPIRCRAICSCFAPNVAIA